MKSLFWNIGSELTGPKLDLITEAIAAEAPDVFCIAEGTPSKKKCILLVKLFEDNGYHCYYSPLFSDNKDLQLGYGYDSFGLKVFLKNQSTANEPFSFEFQRSNGRIIILKSFFNFAPITLIFLHIKAKSGGPDVSYDQYESITNLRDMIKIGKVGDNSQGVTTMGNRERLMLMGDFNLEPWDRPLGHNFFLTTNFLKNRDAVFQRSANNSGKRLFFNPLVELIMNSPIENLGGTYFSEKSGWALYDAILYERADGEILYDIITGFKGGGELLDRSTTVTKRFLNPLIDHLPITSTII